MTACHGAGDLGKALETGAPTHLVPAPSIRGAPPLPPLPYTITPAIALSDISEERMQKFFAKVRSSEEAMRTSRHLFWCCMDLNDDDCITMAYIFCTIGMLDNLRVLWLNRNRIGERGMTALCEVWRQGRLLPSMRSINLGWNEFGDQGAMALATVPLPALSFLNIPKVGMTKAGEKAITDAQGDTMPAGVMTHFTA